MNKPMNIQKNKSNPPIKINQKLTILPRFLKLSLQSLSMSSLTLIFLIFIHLINTTQAIEHTSCLFNGQTYRNGFQWEHDCQNCTCLNSVPICHRIQCKYEPCEKGKLFVLNGDQCCPSCQTSPKSCHYNEYLIEHNTEFSPKNCQICKCKNGVMECLNNCDTLKTSLFDSNPFIESTSLFQRQQRLKQHHRKHRMRSSQLKNTPNVSKKVPCVHDGKVHHFNSTWSPLKCIQCKCSFGGDVDCYVKDCPALIECEHVSSLNFSSPKSLA